MRRLPWWLAAAGSLACSKPAPDAAPAPQPPAAPVASASASAAPGVSHAASPAASRTLRGTYRTAAPVASAGARGRGGQDTTSAVGEGMLELTLEAASGRVTGTLDGVLGSSLLEGIASGARLSASVRRKDPADRGLSGTLTGDLAADRATGTLSLASADGATLRTGTFEVSTGPAR